METLEHTGTGGQDKHHLRKRVWGLVIVLLLIGGWFYLTQYEPMDIRSSCALDASKRAFGGEELATSTKGIERIRQENESFDVYYLLCVRTHGLPN